MSEGHAKLPLTAAVLAGGRSDRMGSDKTLLPVAGEPLVLRVLDVVGQVCEHTLVVTNQPEALVDLSVPPHVRVVTDEVPDQGPLGGLVTALASAETEWVLAVAADLPWLVPGVVRALWDAREGAQIVAPVSASGAEPLLALYHTSCLDPAREYLAAGGRRPVDIFSDVDVVDVPVDDLRLVDPELDSLVNVNTPEELRRARERAPDAADGVRTVVADGDEGSRLPSERPITVYMNGSEIATMQATPADLEDLAVGFLTGEGLLRDRGALESVTIEEETGQVWVASAESVPSDLAERRRYVTAGCGRGVTFASIAHATSVEPVADGPVVSEGVIYETVRSLARAAERYLVTGGMHACGLALDGELVLVREDVGRHNALDKLLGRAWLDGVDTAAAVVASSGRISYEMAVKTAAARVPIVVSRSAVTDLAVDVAEHAGATLIGYARGGRMVVYTRPDRVERGGDSS